MSHLLYIYTIYTVSEVLTLSLDKIFAFYCLSVKDNVCECGYPVPEEYAARVLAKRNINIYVTVTEDEAVDRRMFLKIFTCKDYAMLLLLAKVWCIAILLVFHHAVL